MIEAEQRIRLVGALTEVYIGMPDKNSLRAYKEDIEPLLEGISAEDRFALGSELLPKVALGKKVHSLARLALYLNPLVGGS